MKQAPSKNFSNRREGKAPTMLILHYTAAPSAEVALNWMQDREGKVSAHYLVDVDGEVTRLVAEGMRAWHAGKSFWAGETDINSASIGVEIQNPGVLPEI
ncbi:MAG: N-acetylmuramoyl-L-alanine amidase [Proteobacteria bacterium]|nr:N-acetylmuramoyl-L-alanine amidase [Pseudomonadota bacterium]